MIFQLIIQLWSSRLYKPLGLAFCLISLLFLPAGRLKAQAGNWVSTPGSGECNSITFDAEGNSYVTGTFGGTARFGSTVFNDFTDNTRQSDIFVAKLNSQGVYQWAASAGCPHADYGLAIAVDATGAAYVTGQYSNTAKFGTTTLVTTDAGSGFIAKLSPTGTWEWAVDLCGGDRAFGNSLAVDQNNNVYVRGECELGGTIGSYPLRQHFFIAKFTPSGAPLWVANVGGPSMSGYFSDGALGLDAAGNIYFNGVFDGDITFGATTLRAARYQEDLFVASLTPDGAWRWAVQAGGSENDHNTGFAVDAAGNVLLSGAVRLTTQFGRDHTLRTSSGHFLAMLRPDGTWAWALNQPTAYTVIRQDVFRDARRKPRSFFSVLAHSPQCTGDKNASATEETWVVEIADDGTQRRTTRIDGAASLIIREASCDRDGRLYVAGATRSTTSFVGSEPQPENIVIRKIGQ